MRGDLGRILWIGTLAGLVAIGLAACAGSGGNRPTAALQISLVDPAWQAGSVPMAGRCRECGGGGMSPTLRVVGVPTTATELEVAFRDLTAHSLGQPHQHGALRMATAGQTIVTVPAVRERTSTLPAGVSIARHHGGGPSPRIGYLAPCACDGNNRYEVLVTARRGDTVLARGRLEIGSCCL